MKRRVLTFFLVMTAMVSSADSLTVRSLFQSMPDSLLPYLSRNNRLDFIDFIDSKMKAEVVNELGGTSEMTALTDDSLSIRLNAVSKVDMLLLSTTTQERTIVLIRTLGRENDLTESDVEYFTVQWQPITDKPTFDQTSQKRLDVIVRRLNILNRYIKILNKD
ncbi:MAG: DUF3256 family protein [Prevotella sp.]|nr:DUF3256 family protein [Prevotella sp.]